MASFSEKLKSMNIASEPMVIKSNIAQPSDASIMTLSLEDESIAAYTGDMIEETESFERVNNPLYLWIEDYKDPNYSHIDTLKNVTIDNTQVNLTQEENSQVIPFELDRYYDGIDLSQMTFQIYYINPNGNEGLSTPINVTRSANKIRFFWLIDGGVTAIEGKINFEIRAEGTVYYTANDGSPAAKKYQWKTKPNADLQILKSLAGNGAIEPSVGWDTYLQQVSNLVAEASGSATAARQAATDAQKAIAEVDSKINNASTGIADQTYNKVMAAMETEMSNYYTKEETYNRDEIDDAIKNVEVDLTGYATEDFVQEAIDAIPEIDLSGYALKAEIPSLDGYATETFVTEKIDEADISDKLGNYYTKEETYSKGEVDTALGNVKVDLTGYAKETYVTGITDTLRTDIDKNKTDIQAVNTVITSINETLEGIDKSPKTKYRATYGDVELDDGSTAEYMFTLWKEENGVEEVQDRFQILGGGGSSSSVNMKISYVDGYPQSSVYTINDSVIIKYNFEGIDSAGDYVGGTASWKVGSKIVLTEEVSSGENQVDLTKYVGIGDNKVLLTITHATGAIATKAWTLKVVDVRIESLFDNERTYPANSSVEFTYVPYGSVDKVVHFKLDGKEVGTKVSKSSASGLSDSYMLPAQEHGSHLLEVYMTSDIANSDSIFKDIIWYNEESDIPVVGCSTPELTVMQHDTAEIVFTVFDPSTETPTVTIEDNGTVIGTLSNLEKSTNTYFYSATTVGEHEIALVCGQTRKIINVIIEELNINVTPVKAGLAFDFNPVGYSNNSDNRLWSYDSEVEGQTIAMTVSDNFDWVNGGYQTDDNGSYFCIKAGTTATINYKMFCATKNIGSQGGHYKLVFKTTNVQDSSKPFLQCFKSDVGVIMQPHETNFYAGSGNHLYLAYSENDIIEFELNMGEVIPNSSDKMVMGYEDGVATKPLVYTSGAIFIQGIQDKDAEYITLGSTSCDLYIYRFKAYRKALTSNEVLNNFITDARSASEMLKRYNRNNIYNEAVNDLNYTNGYSEAFIEHFAEQCPDLRVILLSAPRFTKSKDDKVQNCTVRQIYTNGREVEDNWTVYNMMHSGQGTSSNLYGASGRNLDLIMNKKNDADEYPWIEFADGTTLSGKELKLNLTETSVPVNYLNIKLNIASSENANNALLARRYNQFNPYKRPLVREEGYPYEVKDTMEFYNCVVFVQETDTNQDANGNYTAHVEFNDTNWHYYGLGNIGDSKKTDNTRMNDPNDVNEFVVEIMDNNLPNSKFQSGTYDEKGYSITGAKIAEEWQTYKNDTYEMDGKYTVVVNTEKSKYLIDENLPILYELIDGEYVLTSDETIDSTKTYYEKNYPNAAYSGLYKDKYCYDMESKETELESGWGISFECRYEHDDSDHEEHKRIWNEFYEFIIFSSDTEFYNNLHNYCVLNSVMYYYLFTLRYTMIDNRAKNSFFHYGKCEDGKYRWDLTMDYDNDTALGIDNFGKQVFRYGYEDFDYVDDDIEVDEDSTNGSGKAWVFNAATSTFYNRLRLLFAPELRSLYNELDGKGAWNAEDLITQWDASQSQFPEEVWRQDIIRKYIRPYTTSHINGEPDTTFLKEKMNGRKKYHRREFERNQKIYMASKYRTEDAKGNIIRLRAKDPSGDLAVPVNLDLTITPYMHMYVSVDYANGVVTRQYRAKPGVPVVVDYPLDSGDIIAIESAPYIQSIGDISSLYTQEATLTTAIRLKDILLGNSTEGYANTYLSDISMVKDGLIETINIENITSLDDELDVSTLRNLRTVLAKGSGIKGISFARNCPVETLSLPELAMINMKNLNYLKDVDFDSLNYLDRLIIEDCDFSTIENFVINDEVYESPNELTFLDNAPNLQRVRLTNVDWTLSDTNVLERLYDASIGGYNASEQPTTQAYISGKVYVPGIKQYELAKYNARWSDLEITYGSMTPQYIVTFVNDDGTVLDVQYVDMNSDAVDPITREENPIPIPKKEPTVSTVYTFTGWDSTFTNVGRNLTIKATYSESPRKYSIKYIQTFGNKTTVLQDERMVEYGNYCFYDGDNPTYVEEERYNKFYLFKGWDKSGYVDGDKVIAAVYDMCHYANDAYFEEKNLEALKPVEIYALTRLIEDGKISYATNDDGETYIKGSDISDGDHYSFYMGHDYHYDDLESSGKIVTLVDVENPRTFSGSDGDYYDTGINLLSEDRDFVLAVDYEYASGNNNNAVLMDCFDQNNERGFRLQYEDGNASLSWLGKSTVCAPATRREMLILRHIAGDPKLHVYTSNLSGNTHNYVVLTPENPVIPTDYSLIFGCGKQANKNVYYAKGTINWAKLWYTDLGDKACQKLASYIHEHISLRIAGFNRYFLENGALTSIDFIADKALYTQKPIIDSSNSNLGGWAATTLNTWLNTRFYNGMPAQIRQLLKKAKVKSRIDGKSESTDFTYSYIYIPAVSELAGSNDVTYSKSPYTNETDGIPDYIAHITAETRIMKDNNDNAVTYWTRSPGNGGNAGTTYFIYVTETGTFYQFQNSTTSKGIVIELSM